MVDKLRNDSEHVEDSEQDIYAQRLREMNEVLLTASAQQHELAELARKAEAEALRSADKLERIVRTSPVAFAVLSGRDLRFLWTNPTFQFIVGSQQPCVGRLFVDAVQQPFAKELERCLREVVSSGKASRVSSFETDAKTEGHTDWWEGECVPLAYENGSADSVLLLLWDITEHHEYLARLAVRARQQQAIAKLGDYALREDRIQAVFDQTAATLATVLRVNFAEVWELRPDKSEALLRAAAGWDPSLKGRATLSTAEGSLLAFTLSARGPVVLSAVPFEKRFNIPALLSDQRIRTGISCVITGEGRPWGVLSVHSPKDVPFDREDRHFIEFAARLLGNAIRRHQAAETVARVRDDLERQVALRTLELEQRAKQLSRLVSELTILEHRERERLAHVLHDHLQQLLVAAKFRLQTSSRSDATQDERLAVLSSLIDEAISISRTLTVELAPPVLKNVGLAAGLQWLARWMEEKHEIRVTVHSTDQAIVEREDLRILVYQIVRELLLNAVKHSGVKEATVELELNRNVLRAVVSDEGKGFDASLVDSSHGKGGFGIFSIQQRLLHLGGQFDIVSVPGRGTRCSVVVPLDAETGSIERWVESLSEPDDVIESPDLDEAAEASSATPIRILIVENHRVMREGLRLLLSFEPDMHVVGEAADGLEAIEQARALELDVILMDYSMPKMDGVEVIKRIKAEYPLVTIIGLSIYDEPERVQAMLSAGAAGFHTKSADVGILIDMIRTLVRP